MKITIEPTGEFQTVNGAPARVWKGKTESGAEIMAFVATIALHKSATREQHAEFEKALRAVSHERQLVSYDLRLFID